MSTEILPSPLVEGKDWDIAVACDIRLSQLFNDRSRFPKGSYLNIDTSAISTTLKSLENESFGSILFKAVDLDSINNKSEADTITYGNYKRIGELATVQVGVAVSLYSDIRTKTDQSSVDLVRNYGKYKWFDDAMKRADIRDESSIQKTSVHELSHAVALWDKELLTKVVEHDEKYKSNRMDTVFERYLRLHLKDITIDTNTPDIIISATNKFLNKKYLSDPSEKKARFAGEHADDYPQIISIRSRKDERFTNMVNCIVQWCKTVSHKQSRNRE